MYFVACLPMFKSYHKHSKWLILVHNADNCRDCLINKHNINHPSVEPVHHTQVLGFGEQCYKIGENDHDWRFQPALGVDYLCFDSDRDNGLVEYLQYLFARIDAYCSHMSDDEK